MTTTLPGTDTAYRSLSLWHETAGEDWTPRPSLPRDTDADVAIVGAGFTGLWTAYYLLRHDPGLRCSCSSPRSPGSARAAATAAGARRCSRRRSGRCGRGTARAPARALRLALQDAVDEVGRVCVREGIDAHYVKGGTLVAARNPPSSARAHEVAAARALGIGPDDLDLLGADAARARLGVPGAARRDGHAALRRVHPARLVRGLARAVERLGGVVHERTPVTALRAGQVDTPHGRVRAAPRPARHRGLHAGLPGARRAVAPLYSLMIATEPLPASFWATVGLARAETFSDHRHLIIYGQRTADDRLAFGGRGAPYHFASGTGRRTTGARPSTSSSSGRCASCSPGWPATG